MNCTKMENARAMRAKLSFFVVKYVNLRRSCYRRRRGCLSSLMSTWQTIHELGLCLNNDAGKLEICVGWLLPRRVCTASRKQEHSKKNTERCLDAQKHFVRVHFSV